MRKRYSRLLGTSTLLLTVLLGLSFATSGEPVLRKVIQIHLEMYDNQQDINEACQSETNVNGCTYYNPKGVSKVILPVPKNFCDWNAMRTAGHELYHAAGFIHDKTYAVDKWNVQPEWRSRTCAMGRNSK